MSLSDDRITQAALQNLRDIGLRPEAVPLGKTGKSVLEHIVSAISKAIVQEIISHAEVSTGLTKGLAAWIGDASVVPVPMDGGAAIKGLLATLAADKSFDKATGGIA